MTSRIAFDLSGLAWRYRTGVQNLYWAFAEAWARRPESCDDAEIVFYDRSGSFNQRLKNLTGIAYRSSAPPWWPHALRRPMQALIRTTGAFDPELEGRINHVWNWNIFSPAKSPASITIPDVLPLEFPQWFDARLCRVTEQSLNFASTHAQHVFAISDDVRQRVVKATGLTSEKIRVVYPGVDPAYFLKVDGATSSSVARKYGLEPGRYLLSSGFLDPRKNLVRQLQAFAIASSRGAMGYKYALTGVRTALSAEVLRAIESPSLRSNVVFLGYVPRDDLIALTSHAAALMYCSLAEGFGLPIVEAMALGAPVITSNTTSMRELAHSRACLVEPEDVDEIAQAIEETLGSPAETRRARSEGNRQFAARFTIDNWLGGHLDAFSAKTERSRWK